MSKRTVTLLCGVLLVFGVACSVYKYRAPTSSYGGPLVNTYDAPVSDVWDAVVSTFTDLDLPVAEIDGASRFIRTTNMNLRDVSSEHVDCGKVKPPSYDSISVADSVDAPSSFQVTVHVRELESRSQVRIRESATGGAWKVHYRCVPTGRISEQFLERVEARIQ